MPDTPVPRSLVIADGALVFTVNSEGGMSIIMDGSIDYLSPAEVSQLRCWLVDLKEEEMRNAT